MFKHSFSTLTSNECFIEKLTGIHSGIALLNLNRPNSKNAIGRLLLTQFRSSLQSIRYDPNIRVLILASTVENVFCAGADLKERVKMSPMQVSEFVDELRASFLDLETLPIPTIAVLEGSALGGGLELALAADLRIASETARLGLPETKLAIIPGAGGTQRLPRLIGLSKAKQLVFTGSILNYKEASSFGLVDYTVEKSLGLKKALEVATSILPQGPIAIKMAKLAMDKGIQMDLANGLAFEQACYAQVIPTQDRLEGLASFREKRKPIYKGL